MIRGDTLYVALQSEVQYQTMIGNVRVEPTCTCDGEVRCAFTARRADNFKFDEHSFRRT